MMREYTCIGGKIHRGTTMAMIVPIETVTPVWTGDNEKKTSSLSAASFLGGLRFWTEALLRSLRQPSDKPICSATGDDRCAHDRENPENTCAACRIFGCAGLSRGFSLKVGNEQPDHDGKRSKAIGLVELRKYEYMTERGVLSPPTWDLRDPGLVGTFDLVFSSLRPPGDTLANRASSTAALLDGYSALALAAQLLLHWGMLGAKDQYGYGLVRVRETEAAQQFSTLLAGTLKALAGGPDIVPAASELPSLSDFFFFFGQVKASNLPPRMKWDDYARDIPFEIRYQVRNELRKPNENRQDHSRARSKPRWANENRQDQDQELRHYFCGAIEKNKRQASRFNMALDGKTIYGWGHFPSSAERWQAGERDYCLDVLKKKLADSCNRVSWKEFDSDRDTCASKTSWKEFLRELANSPWR
jgi:CRISPR type III-B/RAMP module RAMP protein Cmr1